MSPEKNLPELIREVKKYIDEALGRELDLWKALAQLCDGQSIHILTGHKSKGLEFDTVVFLGIEGQTYF